MSWKKDTGHEKALYSHLRKWQRLELVDPDSGAHPLVHAAWRCLALAYQETHEPETWTDLGELMGYYEGEGR